MRSGPWPGIDDRAAVPRLDRLVPWALAEMGFDFESAIQTADVRARLEKSLAPQNAHLAPRSLRIAVNDAHQASGRMDKPGPGDQWARVETLVRRVSTP